MESPYLLFNLYIIEHAFICIRGFFFLSQTGPSCCSPKAAVIHYWHLPIQTTLTDYGKASPQRSQRKTIRSITGS